MSEDKHPVYDCLYYIWEENLLTSYEDWIKYYEELEHERGDEQQTVQRTTGQIQSTDN